MSGSGWRRNLKPQIITHYTYFTTRALRGHRHEHSINITPNDVTFYVGRDGQQCVDTSLDHLSTGIDRFVAFRILLPPLNEEGSSSDENHTYSRKDTNNRRRNGNSARRFDSTILRCNLPIGIPLIPRSGGLHVIRPGVCTRLLVKKSTDFVNIISILHIVCVPAVSTIIIGSILWRKTNNDVSKWLSTSPCHGTHTLPLFSYPGRHSPRQHNC